MKKFVTAALAIFVTLVCMSKLTDKPDFAYPKQVADAATEELRGDISGAERLRLVGELVKARVEIEPDSMSVMPALIQAEAQRPGLSKADRAMMLTYEADVVTAIYNANGWKYDSVEQPLEPLPADCALWSFAQYEYRVRTLFQEAMTCADADNVALRNYDGAVDVTGAIPAKFVEDISTYVAAKAVATFRQFRNSHALTDVADSIMNARADAAVPGSNAWYFWKCMRLDQRRSSFADYEKLYEAYPDSLGARLPLCRMTSDNRNFDIGDIDNEADLLAVKARIDKITAALEASLRQYPDVYGKEFQNVLTQLSKPKVQIIAGTLCAPGKPTEVKVLAINAPKIELAAFRRLIEGDDLPATKLFANSKPAASLTLVPDSAAYFATRSLTLDAGEYLVAARCGKFSSSSQRVTCAPFIPMLVTGNPNVGVIAMDMTTGAPVRGVQIDESKRDRVTYLTATDAAGFGQFAARNNDNWYQNYLIFSYLGQSYRFDGMSRPAYFSQTEETVARINILTDRNLYHPGDTVRWAVCVARQKAGSKELRVAANQSLDVMLFDANYKECGKVKVTTDGHGRATGEFAIPTDLLSGSWILRADINGEHYTSASRAITVSDFKMPTFTVEMTGLERDYDGNGGVRLTGKARTYSGMPVIGAKVTAKITGHTGWWRYGASAEVCRLDSVTGTTGEFTLDIPGKDLAGKVLANLPMTFFDAQITVTSPAGEAVDAARCFSTGKPCMLSAKAAATTVDTDRGADITLEARNADNDIVPIELHWQLRRCDADSTLALSGTAVSGKAFRPEVSSLEAGAYTLSVSPADAAQADAVPDALTLVLYNERLGLVPDTGTALFLPSPTVKITDGSGELLVGTTAPEAYVYIVRSREGSLGTTEVRRIAKGFTRLDVKGLDAETQLKLISCRDCRTEVHSINVRQAPKEQPVMQASSFRDRLVPGARETWTFRLAEGKGKPMADAAVVATMYNAALDALDSSDFATFLRPYIRRWYIGTESPAFYMQQFGISPGNLSYIPPVGIPSFRYMPRAQRMMYMMSAARSLRVRGTGATNKAMADMAEDVEEEMSLDAAAPMAGAAIPETGEEMADEAKVDVDGADPADAADNFKYRPSEVLQAFWQPRLLTDAEGNVDIVFDVPEANTTWHFRAYGWDSDMQQAAYDAMIEANKPVMVSPTLPRFLRQGDKATVIATVYNNTDSAATVRVTGETFDPVTGKVTATAETTLTLDAMTSGQAKLDVAAPTDAASLGYRVRAVAGNFNDGEQALIPVLEATTTVIESEEFYLNPDATEPFELTYKNKGDATVTLQYCQNPVWTVVKAMRGIYGTDINSMPVLTSRLFSALAAKKIITDNPAVADAIKQWRDNPSEQALTSMLEKNADLKQLLLNQTPWVQAAESNSRRMAALAECLDPATVDASLAATREAMAKLRCEGGGYRWTSWSTEPSAWCTESYLLTMGIARLAGLAPEPALQADFDFLQTEVAKAVAKQPDYTDFYLTLVKALLPELQTTATTREVFKRTIAGIKKGWKEQGTALKAQSVLVLKGFGEDRKAAEIMASIREFAVERPGMGICFPSVDDIRSYADIIQAYKATGASAKELDGLRQWIIVRAQTIDNLGAYNPDYVTASVLLTGSAWTSVPVDNAVTLNGSPLAIAREESATGYFAQKLALAPGKNVITVRPNGQTPSYGSIVTVGRQPLESVAAKAGRDIKVTRRMLVLRDGKWVETSDMRLGERVQVQLTLEVKRDMKYVSIIDERAAALEPVDQLPGYDWNGGLAFYRESGNTATRFFIGFLNAGSYRLSYDATAQVTGSFMGGICTVQSQYAPELTAHSAAHRITVK